MGQAQVSGEIFDPRSVEISETFDRSKIWSLSMKPFRATGLRVGAMCVVITIAGMAGLDCARSAPAGDPMLMSQRPSESRVPLDLFKTWNFDKETAEHAPSGFSSFMVGSPGAPIWVIKSDPSAQSPPNLLKQSVPCGTEDCFQLLLVDDLKYEYLDLIVRLRFVETSGKSSGAAGVVFGARDPQNYYAVTVEKSGQRMQVIRMQEGKPTTLANTEIAPKKVAWHHLRVRRNTIISQEYIEGFFDSVQIFSVEDKTFGSGQIGIVTRGTAMAEFDNLTAAPLYSQKPISGPAAY